MFLLKKIISSINKLFVSSTQPPEQKSHFSNHTTENSYKKNHKRKKEKTSKEQKSIKTSWHKQNNIIASSAKIKHEKKISSKTKQKNYENNNNIEKQSRALPPIPKIREIPQEDGKLRFTDFPLCKEVIAAVQRLNFKYCTEIQKLVFPVALNGFDVAAKAQTGTGKTAAFLATIITKFIENPIVQQRLSGYPRALILAPTRELAIQIYNDFQNISYYTTLNAVVVFGGMDHEKQRQQLNNGIDILIGTPGRIIDYIQSGDLQLKKVEIFVLDEADRMLDMGFIPDVRRIVYHLPKPEDRQTMLFSATLEHKILNLAQTWMRTPKFVESEPEQIVSNRIEQRFYAVLDEEKINLLMNIIRRENPKRMIIFGNHKDKNLLIERKLRAFGENVELLSGDVPQQKRLKILNDFKSGTTNILIATDVASRGIHIDNVSHVINYDLPEQADDYVHRIGRTGRAGGKGISISFVCEFGAFQLPAIEKYLGIEIKTIQPEPEMLHFSPCKKNFHSDIANFSSSENLSQNISN